MLRYTLCALDYIGWSSNSPDLNPIDSVWSIMKRKLEQVDTSSLTKLKGELLKLWEMPEELLQKLADSFPNRLQEVIKKKGNAIKYKDTGKLHSYSFLLFNEYYVAFCVNLSLTASGSLTTKTFGVHCTKFFKWFSL